MLYYLSLLTHTDQLAFFRLFGYLTFRSGAAVITAVIATLGANVRKKHRELAEKALDRLRDL